ncbi:hypothetical protein FHS29_007377 [Saccharothrix tamanrassetensis]|uniref:Nephrocystin 3-like N-terminal domain-containing protein n=1 Tax=Saccharothrix tamanrassetensis TaxID=1051531 RepID=A0A841CTW0_9PSEU|nr:hypothetical protein [Saccharothrix tamanrassetensis]MBB5960749.1 hypothetical protein [Saccharothrix tamanrassetensis]
MVSNEVSGDVSGPVVQAGDMGGTATAPGGYANTGVHIGDVHLAWSSPVRCYYHRRVVEIAPQELVGREAELAEMAAFSTGADSSYMWWRAEAWSGKTALMSWFVLHPPPGVRVVSFFITARWPGQSDRAAFVDVVVEQLAALLNRDLPEHVTAATKETHLLGLLDDAARACHERGEHLVLVVDGLDEDRGLTTGPDAHSIAALLPARLPPGLHVVVSGRPNPPIPADVAEGHPLRAASVIRALIPSPSARTIQRALEQELLHLAEGRVERRLLGLVTAAGGGLTATDLAELTDMSPWQVQHQLRTVTGRTFTRRTSPATATGIEVYVLGHEELQVTATRILADDLPAYRAQLHDWAQTYRERGWPEDTPPYLLGGYFTTLLAARDLDRAVDLATDPARQQCLHDVCGGYGRALAELDAAHDVLAATETFDFVSMLRLSIHRDDLTGSYSRWNRALPAAWAQLGEVDRAVSIARSMGAHSYQAGDRADALIAIAGVIRNRDRAGELLDEAEQVVEYLCASTNLGDFGHRHWRPLAVAAVRVGDRARAFAALNRVAGAEHAVGALCAVAVELWRTHDREPVAGLLDRAETAAREETDPVARTRLLRVVVDTSAAVGDSYRAELLTRSVPDREHRAQLWLLVARAVAARGDAARAGLILDHAEQVIVTMSRQRSRIWAWPDLITAAAAVGDHDRVDRVITRARHESAALARSSDARGFNGNFEDVALVAKLVEALCGIGRIDQALSLSTNWLDYESRKHVLPSIACSAAETGRFDLVDRLLRHFPLLENYDFTLGAVAEVAARLGRHDRARAWLRQVDTSTRLLHRDARAVAGVVVAAAGQARFDLVDTVIGLVDGLSAKASLWRSAICNPDSVGYARTYLDRIEQSAVHAESDAELLVAVEALCDLDRLNQALETVVRMDNNTRPADSMTPAMSAWTAIAKASARTDDVTFALELMEQVWADATSDGRFLPIVAKQVAEALLEIDGVDAVRAFGNTLPPDPSTTEYLAMLIAVEAARTGHAEQAQATARTLTTIQYKADVQIALADAATERGDFDTAETLARSVVDYRWVDCVERLARALLVAGQRERAEALVDSALREHSERTPLRALTADADPVRKARAVAQLLRLGMWTDVVDDLVEMEVGAQLHGVPELRALWLGAAEHGARHLRVLDTITAELARTSIIVS